MPNRLREIVEQNPVEQPELWQRLCEFSFDATDANQAFSLRLARENGWKPEFASRVLDEYRKFLFLSCVVDHIVCPSHEVDVAWHQHLIYSQSYWNDLCPNVLRRPLHHNPSTGGPEEDRKHWELYRKTLASYRTHFAQEPPRDIWPPAYQRFSPNKQFQNIDIQRHWIATKPTWWPQPIRRRTRVAACAIPLMAVGLGPFDLVGPEFLLFFWLIATVLFVAALLIRWKEYSRDVDDDHELQPEEIACLKFGQVGAINATIAGMLRAKELTLIPFKGTLGQVVGSKVTFARGAESPSETEPLARAIYSMVTLSAKSLNELHSSLLEMTTTIENRLREMGYLLKHSQTQRINSFTLISLLGLLIVGGTKIAIGIERNRPVALLVLSCLIVTVLFFAILLNLKRSKAGEGMLVALEWKHRDLKAQIHDPICSRNELALAAGLFGASVLDPVEFEDLRTSFRAARSESWNGSIGSASCGGSACGGGAGCGGGGCGGGGCGGCGG